MGGELLKGWVEANAIPKGVIVVDPVEPTLPCERQDVDHYETIGDMPLSLKPETVVIAVEPQVLYAMGGDLKDINVEKAAVVSIVAGVTISYLQSLFGRNALIIRAMPNLPVSIKSGVTALFPNGKVPTDVFNTVCELFRSVGDVIRLDAEVLFDAVTAVSGSGPAYVFYLIECLAHAGAKAGLDEDTAERLATSTVKGAGILASLSSAMPHELRKRVSSPGGTTLAALEVLARPDCGLQELLEETVAAAAARSQELARR